MTNYDVLDLNRLSGDEFETLCGELLVKIGFEILTTKQSRDGGVDIFAYNNDPFTAGKYVVQCKRFTGSVGEPIIRDLFGVTTSERANKGILITTGVFTSSAKMFATDKPLELIDGTQLQSLIEKHLNDNSCIPAINIEGIFIDSHYDDELIEKYYFLKEFVQVNPNSLGETVSLIEIIEEHFIDASNFQYDEDREMGRIVFQRCVHESEKYWKRIERMTSANKQVGFLKQYALYQRAYNHLRTGNIYESIKNYHDFLKWDCLSEKNIGNKGVEYLGVVAINNVSRICKYVGQSDAANVFVQRHSRIINEYISLLKLNLSKNNMNPRMVPVFNVYLEYMNELLSGNSDVFMSYSIFLGNLMRISQWNDEYKYYPEMNALITTQSPDELPDGLYSFFDVADDQYRNAVKYIKHQMISIK